MTPAEFIDNPQWADFLPENAVPSKTRHLPAHEDCEKLDPEKIAGFLRVGGILGTMPGYEERPGQLDMLTSTVRTFNERRHLMIEAGTGVGKSLAYLLPAVHWAWTNDTPVIVSTETRNLQGQLISSDIPLAVSTLGERADAFRFVKLKGRSNYLCLRAVDDFFASGYWTMSQEEQAAMPEFIDWLKTTPDGDLDGYDGLPRTLLNCPGEECGARRCRYYSRCFLYRARRSAAEAHLVVANHALVLADATTPGAGILPNSGRIVFDEAHELESIATEYLQREFSLPAFARTLSRMYRKSRHKAGRHTGVLAIIERSMEKGVFNERIGRLLAVSNSVIAAASRAVDNTVKIAAKLLEGGKTTRRYRVVNGVRELSVRGLFNPCPESWSETRLTEERRKMEAKIAELINFIHNLRDEVVNLIHNDERGPFSDLATQLENIAEAVVTFANDAAFVLDGGRDSYAYWLEIAGGERETPFIRLIAAPLSIANELRTMIWNVRDSAVLTSATLRVGGDFNYMTRRLGFSPHPAGDGGGDSPIEERERYQCLTAVSPFNYLLQSLTLATDFLPDPSQNIADYSEKLAELLGEVFEVTCGRALVLFTSYEMMKRTANAMDKSGDFELLVQGEGVSREAMTAKLKAAGEKRVVLFGASSFWQGVDVPGAALSCVIMARLPFPQPYDPIVEARSDQIERNGGSSFRDYHLPEAVIRFRQGFGRLIRSNRDRGVVIVTDPRVITKNYGVNFRKSLPTTIHVVTDKNDLLKKIGEFL